MAYEGLKNVARKADEAITCWAEKDADDDYEDHDDEYDGEDDCDGCGCGCDRRGHNMSREGAPSIVRRMCSMTGRIICIT